MFRDTYTGLNMYVFLIAFSLFYSVNSLTEVSNNSSTTVIPPITNKAFSTTVISNLLNEKGSVVTISSTEGPTGEKKETESDIKKNLLEKLNRPPVIGSKCKNNTDCNNAQKNSVCLNGFCQCGADFIATSNNKYCFQKAKALGDECFENAQCDSIYGVSGLAVCFSFQCVCSSNAVLKNNRCYKKTVLGNPCKEDNDCASIQYSYCFQQVCACDPDFSPDDIGTQCFPISNGTSNMTNINCKASSLICKVLGEHAYCSNDTCVCYPGYRLLKNHCIKEKSLGEFCESNSDCEVDMLPKEKPGARECKNNKCVCVKGLKGIPEHNICQSGSSIISRSLLLILGSLFLLLK